MWKKIYQLVKLYRQYLIGAALVTALIFGGKQYISHVETTAYNKGHSDSEQVWEKQRDKYQAQLDAKYRENTELTDALRQRTIEKQEAQSNLDKSSGEKQQRYILTKEAADKSLNDSFMDIYNTSLGEKR